MKLNVFLIIGFVLVGLPALSQFTDEQIEEFVSTANKRELIQRNTVLLNDGFYHQSIIVANKLLEGEPENSNFNYRKGYALLKLSVEYQNAKPHFLKAVKSTSRNFDVFSENETNAPVDSYFYLGRCYHLSEEIDKAKEYYNKYLNKSGGKDEELRKLAELTIKQCDVAEEFMETPRNYQVINLGEKVNSPEPDYAPVVSLDGQAMYFTSRRLRADKSNEAIKEPETNLYMEDVYVSYKDDDGNWSEAELLDFSLPERNDATVAVSTDERRIYMYRDDEGNGDIFYSDFHDGRFRDLERLDIEGLNTDAWEPHLSVSVDGNSIFFTSDREGGYGGRDIYRITKLPNGEWSEALNLGPKINSEYDEDSPFLAIDNKTLYFASNGPNSMGGFDIFVTIRDEDDNWSDPINLGYPLNSMGDDIYYTTTADGFKGYLSSFRDNGLGEKDVYKVVNDYLGTENVAMIAGKIVVAKDQELPDDVAVDITCLNCGDTDTRTVYPRLNDGVFLTNLLPCREYEMVYHHGEKNNNKQEFHREVIKTNCDDDYQQIDKEVFLDVPSMSIKDQDEPVDDELYVFNSISFEYYYNYNNTQVKESNSEFVSFLNEISNQVNDGRENIEILIESSASKVPTRTFKNNMNLANTRSEKIKSLLEGAISKNESLKGKVTVKVHKTGVNGPSYSPAEAGNLSKFAPYQYIKLNVKPEGEINEGDAVKLRSKDGSLKGKID